MHVAFSFFWVKNFTWLSQKANKTECSEMSCLSLCCHFIQYWGKHCEPPGKKTKNIYSMTTDWIRQTWSFKYVINKKHFYTCFHVIIVVLLLFFYRVHQTLTEDSWKAVEIHLRVLLTIILWRGAYNSSVFTYMLKILAAAGVTSQPPSTYSYGINLKIPHCFVFKLLHSQDSQKTWPLILRSRWVRFELLWDFS